VAGNCYRLFARRLPRYELAAPDRLWRHFLANTGEVVVKADHVRVDLKLRTYTPVLIDAGFPELDTAITWWGRRSLRFGFPPRWEPAKTSRELTSRGSRPSEILVGVTATLVTTSSGRRTLWLASQFVDGARSVR
jgi:hypothetical protein